MGNAVVTHVWILMIDRAMGRVCAVMCRLFQHYCRGLRVWFGVGFAARLRAALILFSALTSQNILASTIRGRIADATGGEISGVAITVIQVGGESLPWLATTDADGRYTISDSLMFGNLRVTADKPGVLIRPPFVDFFDDGFGNLTANFVGHTKSPVSTVSFSQSSFGLHASAAVNPVGLSTVAFFEFGVAPAMDRTTTVEILNGNVEVPVSFILYVVPNAGVQFQARLIVSNALGRVEGPVGTFQLPADQHFAIQFYTQVDNSRLPWGIQAADIHGDGRMDYFRSGVASVQGQQMYLGAAPDRWDPVSLCPECDGHHTPARLQNNSWIDWDHDNRPDLIGMESFGGFTCQTTDWRM